jgi:hypothetical protein
MELLIRYNTKSTNDCDRWRLLINEKEFVCKKIKILCESETHFQAINENGRLVEKWHIKPYNFNQVTFDLDADSNLIVSIL